MKKTQFFSGESIDAMQLSVNTWLNEHKNIGIIHSGMGVTGNASQCNYSFYILYEELSAEWPVAVSETLQQSIPEEGLLTNDAGVVNVTPSN